MLPPLAKLRMVVDRLRPLSTDGVTFRANHSGELQLAATTDNARVEVGWGGLNNPGWSAFAPMLRLTHFSSRYLRLHRQIRPARAGMRMARTRKTQRRCTVCSCPTGASTSFSTRTLCQQPLLRVCAPPYYDVPVCLSPILTEMHVGICENHCVILYVYIGNVADAGGVLTYYIPAKFDDAM